MFLIHLNADIVARILSFRNFATSQIWKVLPKYAFRPPPPFFFGGGGWRRSEHAHASFEKRKGEEGKATLGLN